MELFQPTKWTRSRFRGPALAAGSIVAVLTACVSQTIVSPPIVEVNVQVEGVVTERSTGNPIEGALAEVRALTTGGLFAESNTDSTGAYSLAFTYRYFEGDRSPCPFLFIISAQGYAGDTPDLLCTEELQVLNVQLDSF